MTIALSALLVPFRRTAVAGGRGFAPTFAANGLLGLALLLSSPASAHVMSMSSGVLTVDGLEARYELQMPLYEIVHLEQPESSLLANFRVFSEGQEVQRASGSCKADENAGLYRCESAYTLPEPVDRLEIECTFAAVTVPNHVHVLRAAQGENTAQGIFDFSFRRSTIRFAPPTFTETLVTQAGAGFVRVVAGPFQLLFLLALALAGRSRRELLWLALAFVAAEVVAAVVVANIVWEPSARFVEAAAALTVAYLAVEILALPEAGHRWMVAACMGVFHGLYFGGFLRQADMQPAFVMTGVVVAELALLALFAWVLSRLTSAAASLRPVQAGAAALFVVGIVWFVLRVRG